MWFAWLSASEVAPGKESMLANGQPWEPILGDTTDKAVK